MQGRATHARRRLRCQIGGFAARQTARRSHGEENMLRITVMENPLEERWILQGRLTKRSVPELISSWKSAIARPTTRCRIVDLNEVTSIDKSGEEVLSMLVRDGATFVASGVYTRHLLDQLQAREANQKRLD